jgi:hypothetical protein
MASCPLSPIWEHPSWSWSGRDPCRDHTPRLYRRGGRLHSGARPAWGDSLDHLSSAHGRGRPPADRARRSRGGPARRAARGIEVGRGTHEPPVAGGPNVRARGLRLQGGSRARPPGMELRRVRGLHHRRHLRRARRLGPVPRRLPERAVAGSDRSTDRPGSAPGARHRRGRAASRADTFPECSPPAGSGWSPGAARYFFLGTASLSAVGYEHDRSDRVIRLWDEMPREQRISPTLVQGSGEKARR